MSAGSRPRSRLASGLRRLRPRRGALRRLRLPALVVLGAFGLLQLVPYGWEKTNPPVTAPAPWPDPRAEQIARTSCYACHSNETEWPVYSYVAPMSWLVRRHVEEGRDELNFSEWDADAADAVDDAREEIVEGEMPPADYRRVHRDAELTDEEAAVLIDALERMSLGG